VVAVVELGYTQGSPASRGSRGHRLCRQLASTMMRDLRRLPKAHLHLHLDGAMRPETLAELAGAAGLPLPTLPVRGSFEAFGNAMEAVAGAVRRPDELARLVGEVVEDAAADGAVWAEVSVWPGFLRGRLGPDELVVERLLDAGTRASQEHGVGFGLMVAANRNRGPEEAVRVAELAATFVGQGVVSFGLDGDEAAHPAAFYAQAFEIAKSAGLLCTPHAGELRGPDSVQSALDHLHPDRILHGVRAWEDADVTERLVSHAVALDVCPTSNVALGVYADLSEHPLPHLLEASVACSINADDPLMFGTSLLGEYEACRQAFQLTDAQLADCARVSLRESGAPKETIANGLNGVDAWVFEAAS
jgi:adenosine deaminase